MIARWKFISASAAGMLIFGCCAMITLRLPAQTAGELLQPTNGIFREYWTNLPGVTVHSLTDDPKFPLNPDGVSWCANFETPDAGENYGQRLRGLLLAPATGYYTFWIASDDNSELWLSADEDPAHRHRIAKVSSYTGERDWTKYFEQRSDPIWLEAGKCYYIEALHKQGSGWNNLSVAWQVPGKNPELITGQWLRPWKGRPTDETNENPNPVEAFPPGGHLQPAGTVSNLPSLLSVAQIRKPAQPQSVHPGARTRLRGTVTYSFNNFDFYLQDDTGGIFVEARNNLTNRLSVGDVVAVEGVVGGEATAPDVAAAKIEILGHVFLPDAKPIALDPLHAGLPGIAEFAGNADGERVEIEGIVRSASVQDDWINGRNLILKIITTGGQFDVRCPEPGDRSMESWIDASIRVRGVASVNPQQQSVGLIIYTPRLADIYIQGAPSSDVFSMPLRSIRSLIQFYQHDVGHRVGVEGTVLYSEPGRMLFVRDDTGAMQIFTSQRESLEPGDKVRVVGFPAPGNFTPVLTDAIFKKMGASAAVKAAPAKTGEILDGRLNCDLVTLDGTLVDYVFGSDKQGFWIKSGDTLFDAYWSATNGLPAATRFEKDSVLKIAGIALVQLSDVAKSPQTFHVLLPAADAVTVLKRPPLLTATRLFWTSAILLAAILLGLAWVAFLSKKKKMLEDEVVRRQRAEKELQQAHQELEKRMTAELHEEINRREQTEAEFQAVLGERTRIAQELHDTLEQGLVGIALQLDNVADVILQDTKVAKDHLESARRLVEHSQAETRRSVWDLRSQNLEQGGLLAALKTVAQEMSAGANVPVEVVSSGNPIGLPVLVENNLFRIGQEALTNALKHARAKRISVLLEFQPDAVILEIQDDGVGFDASQPPKDGRHFGLHGIRERTKRLDGTLEVRSEQNQGTQIRVSVRVNGAREKMVSED